MKKWMENVKIFQTLLAVLLIISSSIWFFANMQNQISLLNVELRNLKEEIQDLKVEIQKIEQELRYKRIDIKS